MSVVGRGAGEAVTVPLRQRVEEVLERLSRLLAEHSSQDLTASSDLLDPGEAAEARRTVRFLGQLVAGWAQLPPGALPPEGAGFGSTVMVQDLENGGRESYTLMTGAFLDLDAGQVSLESPIGRALLASTAGDGVVVETPQRVRRLRVLGVRTLEDRLGRIPMPVA
jgi:transcription elongation GreA/GreB family factor